MQHQLETFLAQLLTDARVRDRFIGDPFAVAREHGLPPDEARALAVISPHDLRAAARSFDHKRNAKRRRGLPSWLRRLFQRVA
jgi:hypothetical protein